MTAYISVDEAWSDEQAAAIIESTAGCVSYVNVPSSAGPLTVLALLARMANDGSCSLEVSSSSQQHRTSASAWHPIAVALCNNSLPLFKSLSLGAGPSPTDFDDRLFAELISALSGNTAIEYLTIN